MYLQSGRQATGPLRAISFFPTFLRECHLPILHTSKGHGSGFNHRFHGLCDVWSFLYLRNSDAVSGYSPTRLPSNAEMRLLPCATAPSHSARPRSMAGARPPDINAEATRIKRFMSASIPPVRMPSGSNAVTMGWRQRSTSASVAPDWAANASRVAALMGGSTQAILVPSYTGSCGKYQSGQGDISHAEERQKYAAFLPSRIVCRGCSKAGSNSGEITAAGVAPAGGVESTGC